MKIKVLLVLIMSMLLVSCINANETDQEILNKENREATDEQLLLSAKTLTEEIIYSIYRGEENYTYECLLYALASDDSKGNLYGEYFPFDEERQSFIFSMDKAKEALIEIFGYKEYSFENLFDYDKEFNTYCKCLDFGWNTGYIAESITSNISDDKLEIYTEFKLINLWYCVDGDPVPTCIADCKMIFNVVRNDNKSYLRFEKIEFDWNEDIKID